MDYKRFYNGKICRQKLLNVMILIIQLVLGEQNIYP